MSDYLLSRVRLASTERYLAEEESRTQAKKLNNAEFKEMHHKAAADREARKANDLAEENKRLAEENDFYKELLSKPMKEIAKENGDFREAYQKQQEILATWMVSQRAFKEIAMKYGTQAGKTKEEIISESKETEEKVLNNETEYDNHVEDLQINGLYLKEIHKRKLNRMK